MNTKEKANELVQKFKMVSESMTINDAIDCAIITIDENIDAVDWHDFLFPNDTVNYLNEVKNELIKMKG